MRNDTSRYVTGILKNQNCPVVRIATSVEHIHILFLLSRQQSLANVVGATKRNSSSWIKQQEWARLNTDFAKFRWQSGYGAFSVSQSRMQDVIEYIDQQDEHHRRITFQDEYRAFMKRHSVQFDERYVWD